MLDQLPPYLSLVFLLVALDIHQHRVVVMVGIRLGCSAVAKQAAGCLPTTVVVEPHQADRVAGHIRPTRMVTQMQLLELCADRNASRRHRAIFAA